MQENTHTFQSEHYKRLLNHPPFEQAGFTAASQEQDPWRCRGGEEVGAAGESKEDTTATPRELPEKVGLLPSDLDSESSSKAAASPKSTFPRK